MPKERASIKGGEVVSVEVGKVWTVVKIKVPTAYVVKQGLKRNPESPAKASRPPNKAWVKIKANKAAAAAGAGN